MCLSSLFLPNPLQARGIHQSPAGGGGPSDTLPCCLDGGRSSGRLRFILQCIDRLSSAHCVQTGYIPRRAPLNSNLNFSCLFRHSRCLRRCRSSQVRHALKFGKRSFFPSDSGASTSSRPSLAPPCGKLRSERRVSTKQEHFVSTRVKGFKEIFTPPVI